MLFSYPFPFPEDAERVSERRRELVGLARVFAGKFDVCRLVGWPNSRLSDV